MKRRIAIIILSWALTAAAGVAYLTTSAKANARIAGLEHDKEVLSRLCGVVMCVPCNKGESGVQCQARMGDRYEVIYYPDAQAYVAELRDGGE